MILVTGGTGLLGSHLLYQLVQQESEIRALYRDEKRLKHVKSLFHYYNSEQSANLFDKIQWIKGDIIDVVELDEAMEGVDFVYHCAGFVSFEGKDFKKLMKINREGTANVVNCCLEKGIKKLCHVSSTAAIGVGKDGYTTEETVWKNGNETSGYSVSKYSAEKEVWRGVEEGLSAVIVNPCVIFGAGYWDESSLTIFRTVNNGLRFFTNGCNSFVDARDVAEIMIQLMQSPIESERFLCTGENVTFRELMTKIAIGLGKQPPSISTPKWLVGIAWRIARIGALFSGRKATLTKDSANSSFKKIIYDSSKVQNTLNFRFKSLDETIDNTIKGRLD